MAALYDSCVLENIFSMEIKVISPDEALHYCEREEDHFFDRKAFKIKGDKLQRIAVAFANSDGGEFVVGIADDKEESDPAKRWQPGENVEAFNNIIQSLSDPIPSIDFECKFLRQEGVRGYVLLVKIEKGLQVHETLQKKVIIRKGAQSLELKGALKIQELNYAKGLKSCEDDLVIDSSIDDLESSKVLADYLKHLPSEKLEPLDFLIKQNLVDRNKWIPKVASLLLFSENPSNEIPRACAIRIAMYDTKDDAPERDSLTDDLFTIEGSLINQIQDTYSKIVELCSKNLVWTFDGIKPQSYPKETLWEFIVNSVIHRDYSISDHVHIGVFKDRIEIKSPGKLPGFVKVDNILDSRFSRNSKLVRFLSRYPGAPNKDLGEGVNTAFQRMEELGLKLPKIEEDGNYVRVSIFHSSNLPVDDAIIKFVEKHGSINNHQARDLTGVRESEKITSMFAKLRDQSVLLKGDAKAVQNTVWTLA
jgi:ATP-dependent DNA helicase RecG